MSQNLINDIFTPHFYNLLVSYAINIASALLIFFIGWWIIKIFTSILGRTLQKRKVDKTIGKFICQLSYATFMVIIFITALSKLGVPTASLITLIGAMTLAIGLSLKNSLSNFASGILLISTQVFKIDEAIKVGSTVGTVHKIGLLFTVLRSANGEIISLPNSKVMNSEIVNFTKMAKRRINLTIGISYDDSIDKAKATIDKIIATDKRILPEPAANIIVAELADSSVNLNVLAWVAPKDYKNVCYALNESIKKQFDKNGLSLPYPQQDLHIKSYASL